MTDKSDRRTSLILTIVFRVALNTGIVVFFVRTFPLFFVLTGGVKAIMFVGLVLSFLNWIIVPILQILSLPIKFFAWFIGFLLVNATALWLTVALVEALQVEGVSLSIGGGIIGWITLSFVLGFANWLVRKILK